MSEQPPASKQLSQHGCLVAAPWRSSGKTTFTIGLAALHHSTGYAVRCFKKGPDYLDPAWLSRASGQACYNLDQWTQGREEISQTFKAGMSGCEIAIVEGNMGLHDGMSDDGSDSSAGLAQLLGLPVTLVVNCRGMHRTVAALIAGLQQFDPQLPMAGVVLNCIAGSRHEQKLRRSIETHCDVAVIGALPRERSLQIPERELGLQPMAQVNDAQVQVDAIAKWVGEHCDWQRALSPQLSTPSSIPNCNETHEVEYQRPRNRGIAINATPSPQPSAATKRGHGLKIGLIHDQAFHFYYADDIERLQAYGVEVVELSALQDPFPSDLDGLIIGGGFPERYAAQLAANQAFRQALHSAIESGLPVHAECGGLMYLCRELSSDDVEYHPMVGCIDASVTMCSKPVGRGYAQLQDLHTPATATLPAHEFHFSKLRIHSPQKYRYQSVRGSGINGQCDGLVYKNVIASYAHFRHTHATPWLDWLLERVDKHRQSRVSNAVGCCVAGLAGHVPIGTVEPSIKLSNLANGTINNVQGN